MQIPKLWGGSPGTGELPELIIHMIKELSSFNALSLILGLVTIAIILVFRRLIPKLPMSVIMLIIGGIRYVVSGGDSKKVTDAKNTVLYAIIGLVICFFSYAIVNFVITSLPSSNNATKANESTSYLTETTQG